MLKQLHTPTSELLKFTKHCPQELVQLCWDCWADNPAARPCIEQLYQRVAGLFERHATSHCGLHILPSLRRGGRSSSGGRSSGNSLDSAGSVINSKASSVSGLPMSVSEAVEKMMAMHSIPLWDVDEEDRRRAASASG